MSHGTLPDPTFHLNGGHLGRYQALCFAQRLRIPGGATQICRGAGLFPLAGRWVRPYANPAQTSVQGMAKSQRAEGVHPPRYHQSRRCAANALDGLIPDRR